MVLNVSVPCTFEDFGCFLLTFTLDERSAGIWDDFHVVDGRLVTGQNPASATSTAKAVVDVFEKL